MSDYQTIITLFREWEIRSVIPICGFASFPTKKKLLPLSFAVAYDPTNYRHQSGLYMRPCKHRKIFTFDLKKGDNRVIRTGLWCWFCFQRRGSTMHSCPTITLEHLTYWAELVLTFWPLALDVSPSLSDMRGATWPHKSSPCLRSQTAVFSSDSEPMFNCTGALSQILHHHVFILAGGGRADDGAKWGEKQTHTGPKSPHLSCEEAVPLKRQ